MKQFYLIATTFVLTLLFSTTKSYAQTTQEEFNYITKGFKVQEESGLDMKKGYSFVELGDWGLNSGAEKRKCIFKGLVRQGQTKPCAIMMIYKRNTENPTAPTYYLCIPSTNSPEEIWQQTLALLKTNLSGQDAMQTAIWALMKFCSLQATAAPAAAIPTTK